MLPKVVKKEESRALRVAGLSLSEISAELSVSKSSVSVWTRDIVLDKEAIERIKGIRQLARMSGGQEKIKTHRSRRDVFREEGGIKAAMGDPLHLKGCMLYWAEGGKQRNRMHFCNSDPTMIKLFMSFLIDCFRVSPNSVIVRVFCYDDVNPLESILAYWEEIIDFPGFQMKSAVVNRYNSLSKGKRVGKLAYGTCHIHVDSTAIMQHIYGALEVYGGVVIDP